MAQIGDGKLPPAADLTVIAVLAVGSAIAGVALAAPLITAGGGSAVHPSLAVAAYVFLSSLPFTFAAGLLLLFFCASDGPALPPAAAAAAGHFSGATLAAAATTLVFGSAIFLISFFVG